MKVKSRILDTLNLKGSRSLCLLLVVLILLVSVSTGVVGTWSAPQNITVSNYSTWQVSTLDEALPLINNFLVAQKAGTAERPYRDNTTYSEGSLQALKTAFDAAYLLPAGTTDSGKNLARMQLIRCVQQLERKAVFGENDPSKILLNNYPNSKNTANGQYTVEMKYNQEESPPVSTGAYDVIFVLDWSNSMNHSFTHAPPLGQITRPVEPNCARLIVKDTVLSISRSLFDTYEDSRISLVGLNVPAEHTMGNNRSALHVDENTGFVGADEYQSIINGVFSVEPTNSSDDPAQFMAYAVEQLDARTDKTRTPVVIMISDFQIYFKLDGQVFIDYSKNYWEKIMPAQVDSFAEKYDDGILIALRADHYGNRTFGNGINMDATADSNMTNYFINRSNWGFAKVTQNNYTTVYNDVLNLIKDTLPPAASNFTVVDPMGPKYNYVNGTWTGTDNSVTYSQTNDTVVYRDDSTFESQYKILADTTKLTGVLPETKYVTNGTTSLTYDEGTTKWFSNLPTGFLPVTQMAVELYTLEGTESERLNPSNYSLEKVLAAEDISGYGGTGSYDIDSSLTSLPYGTVVTRNNIWNKLITKYGSYLSGYTRQDGTTLTASQLQVVFDAGKNVFKVYAFKEKEANISATKSARVLPSTTKNPGTEEAPVQVYVNDVIEYNIDISGLIVGNRAVVTDILPANMEFVSSSHEYTLSKTDGRDKVVWSITPTVSNMSITVRAKVLSIGTFVNTATVATGSVLSETNATYHETVPFSATKKAKVLPDGSESAGTADNPVPVKVGDTIEYTLTATGVSIGEEIVFIDTLPNGLSYVEGSSDIFAVIPSGDNILLVWKITSASSVESVSFKVSVTAAGVYENTAQVSRGGKSEHTNSTYHEAKEVKIVHKFLEYANETNVLKAEYNITNPYSADYTLDSGIPPAVIEKDSKNYEYYGYKINDGPLIIGAPPAPVLKNTITDNTVTFLYRTKYKITLKYHDESSPFEAIAGDLVNYAEVYSGGSFLPSSTTPQEIRIYEGYYYAYTEKYKLENDSAQSINESVAVENIKSDMVVIYTYKRTIKVPADKLILHIRQVVLSPRPEIPLPAVGYINILYNTGMSDENANIVCNSGTEFQTVLYVDCALDYSGDFYILEDRIPQQYIYSGYVITDSDIEHNPEDRVDDMCVVVNDETSEYWITFYITPNYQPTDYTWDYKTNDFGVIAPPRNM